MPNKTPRKLRPVQDEYLFWLLLDDRTKRLHNLPTSQAEFARMKGVTDRTLRDWKSKPEFQSALEKRRQQMVDHHTAGSTIALKVGGERGPEHGRTAAKVASRNTPDLPLDANSRVSDPDLTDDERSYLRAKEVLIKQAEDGDPQAQALYFKTYGQHFVEAEQRADTVLAGMTDDQLVSEVCSMLGADRVAEWLASEASLAAFGA